MERISTELANASSSGYSYNWEEIDYFLQGDTCIDDTTYHKLYKNTISGTYYSIGPNGGAHNNINPLTYNYLKDY